MKKKEEKRENLSQPTNTIILEPSKKPKLSTPTQIDTKRGTILTKGEIDSVHEVIPLRFRNRPWRLLYSTREHGISLQTLYKNCLQQGSCLLIVKTENFETLGAFAPEPFLINHAKYYGSGETILFTFKNDKFQTYRWTQKNENFVYSGKQYLSFGGPRPALCLNEELKDGSSYPSDTYGNTESLTSTPNFDCYVAEVWCLDKPAKASDERSHSLDIPRGLNATSSLSGHTRESLDRMDVRGSQTRASLDFFR
jgi:hypothetical protein